MQDLLVLFLGLSVGLSSSLLGLGGNVVIVPLLPLITALELKVVVATGITTVFLVTLINTVFFLRDRLVDLKLVLWLFFPSSLASFLAAGTIQYIPADWIRYTITFILVIMILRLISRKKQSNTLAKKTSTGILLIASFISGVTAGVTGVGTGVLMSPLLLTFQIIDPKKVGPTINALICLTSFSSCLKFLTSSNFAFPQWGLIRLDYVFFLSTAAVFSAFWGRRWNKRIAADTRKRILAFCLFLLLLKMIHSIL
jgi:uncharacterized membrane protein YfcA